MDFFQHYSSNGYNYAVEALVMDEFQISLEACLSGAVPKEIFSFLAEDIHECSWGGVLLADAMFVSFEKEGVINLLKNKKSGFYDLVLQEGVHWETILNLIVFSFDRTYLDLFKIKVLQVMDQI